MSLSIALFSCDKESVVQSDDLPGKASNFISTHYSTVRTLQVVKERDDLKVNFHVYLENGTRLDFTKSGDIKEIDGTTRIPDAILPSMIVSYVNTNYPAAFIRGWNPDDTDQEVKLSSDVELLFDSNGNFLRVD